MKKIVAIVLSVILVLILVYLGASYYVGGQALKFHDQILAEVNSSKDLRASSVSYERGLFRSKAVTKLTLLDPRKGRSMHFEVIDTIYQGPFVFLHDAHFKGVLRPVMAVIRTRPAAAGELKGVLQEVPELASSQVLTVLSIDGGAVSYLDIPSFQHKFASNKGGPTEVTWGGLAGVLRLGVRQRNAVGSCDCPSLLVSGEDGHVRMEGMRGRFDSHTGIKGMSVGSSVFSVGSLEAAEKGQNVFTLDSLSVKAQSGVEGSRINGSIRAGFKKLDTGVIGLGPFSIDLEARKLDAAVLARFQRLVPVVEREEMGKDSSASGELRAALIKLATDLLAGRPEFAIKHFALRTDKGDVTGEARLAFDGNGKSHSRNILALVMSVNARAKLCVSQALFYFVAQNTLQKSGASDPNQAKTAAQQLAARLLASKYMVADSGAFKTSAAFKHGVFKVNGSTLGLSNMR